MRPLGAILLGLVLVAATLWVLPKQQEGFPHRAHARMFPLCESCHAGIVSGDSLEQFPGAASCTRCHDGRTERTTSWSGPRARTSNLAFTHIAHERATQARGSTLDCQSCHAESPTSAWMAVGAARAESCLGCHEQGQRVVAHLAAESPCGTCHVSLVDARQLSVSRIAGFPQPASHSEPDFLSTHAPTSAMATANCSVCHAAQSCARCHANALRLPAVAALGSDARVQQVVQEKRAVYPTPQSHQSRDFLRLHGAPALRDVNSCASCHTRQSCQSCHASGGARATIAQLPDPAGTATGVLAEVRVRVHSARFAETHRMEAASNGASCTSCHEQKFCTDCHRGAESRRFHPPNFAARHGTDSYAAATECASCHNREVFCRSCHTGLGLAAAEAARTGAFHNRQPLWLLQHGQGARQNLESCTTCHTQTSCLRCHSEKGGWGVSPHGPAFNARREHARNPVTCARCHWGRPPGT
jgi:predicted CXXCH cytochrome family protein